ncbi:MAG: hypothetical protein WB565_10305 [Acidimicrobiales bacterium]
MKIFATGTLVIVPVYIAAVIVAGFGFATIFDWLGFGRRLYEFSADMPGGSWYRRTGLSTFRKLIGGSALGFSLLLFVVATAILISKVS